MILVPAVKPISPRLVLVAGLLALFTAAVTQAGEPSQTPILRLDPGTHTALIRAVAIDEERGFFVTSSDDKTIRVWDLHSLELLRTLRTPIGDGNEGRLFALALHPNGRTIAVAGWTGIEWDGTSSIYVLDLLQERLIGRIQTGLPVAVGALGYSPDGRALAAVLHEGEGLRVYETSRYSEIARDTDYQALSYALDWSDKGSLVTGALDGRLRLYDSAYSRIANIATESGSEITDVAFRPGTDEIAVGFWDSRAIERRSGPQLSSLGHASAEGVKGQTRVATVAWSPDGETLYGACGYEGDGRESILAWSGPDFAHRRAFPVAQNRVCTLEGLGDSRMLVATEDGSLSILDRDGRSIASRVSPVPSFRDLRDRLRISPDGDRVAVPTDAGVRIFDVGGQRLRAPRPGEVEALAPPVVLGKKIALEGWRDSGKPTLRGRRLELGRNEIVRALALLPAERGFILGTEFAIRRFEPDGTLRWVRAMPQVTWAVTVSNRGGWVIAGLSDGTLRWLDVETGRERLALFVTRDATEWVAWTPSGRYLSSPHGDELLGFHLNQGTQTLPLFFRAVQFERVLYDPAGVRQAFLTGPSGGVNAVARARSLIGQADPLDALRKIAPPTVQVAELESLKPQLQGPVATIRYAATPGSNPMRSAVVYVNDIPVTPYAERAIRIDEQELLVREVQIALPEAHNRVRIEVDAGVSMGVREFVAFNTGKVAEPKSGRLRVLAVGVNALPARPSVSLEFAAQDAIAVASAFERQAGRAFESVESVVLADGGDLPTRAAILAMLPRLRETRAGDTSILFLAAHGVRDGGGNYYMIPRDASAEDMDRVLASVEASTPHAVDPKQVPSLVGWSVFFDALRTASGRRLLIVDTCQAKGIGGTFEYTSLAKRSAASSFALLAASQEDEESQEYRVGGHGLFTYALLRGIERFGDRDGDGKIQLRELADWTREFVEREASPNASTSQTPQLEAPESLAKLIVAELGEPNRAADQPAN